MPEDAGAAAEFMTNAMMAEMGGLGGFVTEAARPLLLRALQSLHTRGLWHQGPHGGPTEADELWAALEVKDGWRVVEAVLIGKLVNFASEEGHPPVISLAVTDGVDWVTECGLLHAALAVKNSQPWRELDED